MMRISILQLLRRSLYAIAGSFSLYNYFTSNEANLTHLASGISFLGEAIAPEQVRPVTAVSHFTTGSSLATLGALSGSPETLGTSLLHYYAHFTHHSTASSHIESPAQPNDLANQNRGMLFGLMAHQIYQHNPQANNVQVHPPREAKKAAPAA